jgi:hypothetical protein
MAITKSNKQELSLNHGKPNEKGGCTLATPYALMRSLILDSQITISSLGSCTSLHMKGVSQLNKWARNLKWTSRGCIYTPLNQSQPLCANSTFFVLTGRVGQCDRTRPVGGNGRFWNQGRWVTGHVRLLETFSGSSLFLLHCWPDGLKLCPISSPSRPVANPGSVDRRQRHLRVRSWTHQRSVR